MALLICPECGSTLSEHATGCPTCGCPMDTILEITAKKKQALLKYKESMESLITESANSYWNKRCSLMADEDTRFQNEKKKLEEAENILIEHVAESKKKITEQNQHIDELSKEIKTLGLLKNRKRNQLQSEIDDINRKCRELLSQMQEKNDELKSKKAENLRLHHEKFRTVHTSLMNQYYVSEIANDQIYAWRSCLSVDDVIRTTLSSERYMVFIIRDILEIGSPIEKEQLFSCLPFSDGEYGSIVNRQLIRILHDKEKKVLARIGKIQLSECEFYTFMSDSEYDNRLRELYGLLSKDDLHLLVSEQKLLDTYDSDRQNKPAGVIKRAALGWVIAGPAGAVIGGLSAVDKNNRSK